MNVAIIGGGPAGLMAADVLSQSQYCVHVYDAMPSVGRKFLLAGKGGMNITHSEPFEKFLSRYGEQHKKLSLYLNDFTPQELRNWIHGLGIQTFVGSSGRVFPIEMKAAPLLRAWLHRLRGRQVHFYMRHRWLGWIDGQQTHLLFSTPEGKKTVQIDAVVLALGGASWKHLGSTGAWWSLLREKGIELSPLQPANCGFHVHWSTYFKEHFAGQPLKNVCLSLQHPQGQFFLQTGECVVTEHGVEGGLIYAVSAMARELINQQGYAEITLDLSPHRAVDTLTEKLNQPRGKESWSNILRKRVHLDRVKIALLKEIISADDWNNPELLAKAIKQLPLRLMAPRPIDEAISSAGGVCFSALNEDLMLRHFPGVFCAGEMLDWEAPTGGYLLTACFATGRAAGFGVLSWLQTQHQAQTNYDDG